MEKNKIYIPIFSTANPITPNRGITIKHPTTCTQKPIQEITILIFACPIIANRLEFIALNEPFKNAAIKKRRINGTTFI